MMSKKSFFVILVLSIMLTYSLAIVDALVNPSSNLAGLPFKFGSYSLFGQANTNYSILLLDILFWFIVILVTEKILIKFFKKK